MLRADLLLRHWEGWTVVPLFAFSILQCISFLAPLLSTMFHQASDLILQVSMSSLELGLSLQLFTNLKIEVLLLIDSLSQLLRCLGNVTLRVLVHDLQLVEQFSLIANQGFLLV